MGGKLSLKALQSSDRFELVAMADLLPDVRDQIKKEYPHIRTFSTHQEMFSQCPTDVVCVSVYPPSHKEVAYDALELPLKGILVEKPLGDTTKAGEEILAKIKGQNLPMAVPHGLLVAKHSTEILDRVHKGEIGSLLLYEVESDKWDIINAGIHWLNFFVTLVKSEAMDYVLCTCDTSTSTYRDGMQVETEAVTYVVTKSGVRAVMQTGDYIKTTEEGKDSVFRLVGSKGVIEFWSWESAYKIVNAEYPDGKLFKIKPHHRPGHRIHLENMAVQMDKGITNYSIAESSLAALELCEGAYLSNKHRCKVTLPLSGFSPPPETDWQPGQPYSGSGGGRDGRKLE